MGEPSIFPQKEIDIGILIGFIKTMYHFWTISFWFKSPYFEYSSAAILNMQHISVGYACQAPATDTNPT